MASHVLILASWYPSDAHDVSGVFFRDQAQALAEHGHRVGVVAVHMRSLRTLGQNVSQQVGALCEVDEGIPTYRRRIWATLPRIPYGNYLLYKRAVESLLRQYVRERGWPDLIHAHCAIYAGVVAAEWGRKRGIPVVLTEHSTGFARRIYRPWQLHLAGRAFSAIDACITVSPALGELIGTQAPSSRGRWAWVPNVVAQRFQNEVIQLQPGNRPYRLLNLALMTEKKGQRDLLIAFARAFGAGTDRVELWMAGDGPLRIALHSLAHKLGIGSRVHFLGRVSPEAVPGLLAEIDAMAVASHYETFGVVAAEALVAGVPVVATRCGGPDCIVREGDGYLVPVGDIEALANALLAMINELPSIDKKAIADRARERFSELAVANQLTAIFEEVLAKSTRAKQSG